MDHLHDITVIVFRILLVLHDQLAKLFVQEESVDFVVKFLQTLQTQMYDHSDFLFCWVFRSLFIPFVKLLNDLVHQGKICHV